MQSRGVVDGVLGKLGGTGSLVGRGARIIKDGAVSAARASWRAITGLVPERASVSPKDELPPVICPPPPQLPPTISIGNDHRCSAELLVAQQCPQLQF